MTQSYLEDTAPQPIGLRPHADRAGVFGVEGAAKAIHGSAQVPLAPGALAASVAPGVTTEAWPAAEGPRRAPQSPSTAHHGAGQSPEQVVVAPFVKTSYGSPGSSGDSTATLAGPPRRPWTPGQPTEGVRAAELVGVVPRHAGPPLPLAPRPYVDQRRTPAAGVAAPSAADLAAVLQAACRPAAAAAHGVDAVPTRTPVRPQDPMFVEWLAYMPLRPPLPVEQAAALAAVLWRQTFAQGEHLVQRSERVRWVLWMAAGMGRLELADDAGVFHPAAPIKPGEVAGPEALLGVPRHRDAVVAATDCEVYGMSTEQFAELRQAMPAAAFALLAALAEQNARRLRADVGRVERVAMSALGTAAPAPLRPERDSRLSRLVGRVFGRDKDKP